MAIEIVSFPMKNGGSFHSYVKLPEGIPYVMENKKGLKPPTRMCPKIGYPNYPPPNHSV